MEECSMWLKVSIVLGVRGAWRLGSRACLPRESAQRRASEESPGREGTNQDRSIFFELPASYQVPASIVVIETAPTSPPALVFSTLLTSPSLRVHSQCRCFTVEQFLKTLSIPFTSAVRASVSAATKYHVSWDSRSRVSTSRWRANVRFAGVLNIALAKMMGTLEGVLTVKESLVAISHLERLGDWWEVKGTPLISTEESWRSSSNGPLRLKYGPCNQSNMLTPLTIFEPPLRGLHLSPRRLPTPARHQPPLH